VVVGFLGGIFPISRTWLETVQEIKCIYHKS
jgi:hypothetical protein